MQTALSQEQPTLSAKAKLLAYVRHKIGYAKKPAFLEDLCTWTATRFLSRIHHLTHRVPVTLRELERDRLLVVAPHMDDEMIGCGGTLALHHQLGSELGLVFAADCAGTSGDAEKNQREAKVRQAEAAVAARHFEMQYFGTLGYSTGSLSCFEESLGHDLAEIITDWKPKTLFCPFPSDHHRDHQATALGVSHALRATNWKGKVWGYEIWSTLWPNVAVDISGAVERKRKAIECYPSQLEHMSYVESTLGLNRYRGLRVQKEYAEAFYVCPAKEFVTLCSSLLDF